VFLFLFVGKTQDWSIYLGGLLCIIGSLIMFTEDSLELQSIRRDDA